MKEASKSKKQKKEKESVREGSGERRRKSVFITNEGQFVSQTADKKLITTSSTIENPLLSLDVKATICNILEPLHSQH